MVLITLLLTVLIIFLFMFPGHRSCRRLAIILCKNEPCPPRVPCTWSENQHPISPERARKPKVPQWKRRHVLHRRESAVIPFSTESEPCSEVVKLYWFGSGERTKHSVGHIVETSWHKASYSSDCSRYVIQASIGNKEMSSHVYTRHFELLFTSISCLGTSQMSGAHELLLISLCFDGNQWD